MNGFRPRYRDLAVVGFVLGLCGALSLATRVREIAVLAPRASRRPPDRRELAAVGMCAVWPTERRLVGEAEAADADPADGTARFV